MHIEMYNVNRFRSKIFKALSDIYRLEILEILRDEEKCVCDIAQHFGIPQPLVSRNLKILKTCGLVKQRGEGTRRFYSVTDPRILELIDSITPDLVNTLSKRAIEQITA
ncbi:MAG: metalloregulator ArsR/SmtB family transcription factor [Candidatus Bathyarchaeia archaeon]